MRSTGWGARVCLVGALIALTATVATAGYRLEVVEKPNGNLDSTHFMDEYYYLVAAVDSAAIGCPPSSSYDYLFWDDADSTIAFKVGVNTADLNYLTAAAQIEDAIEAWDDIDSAYLTMDYDGILGYLTNDVDDGMNAIFWSYHSSLSGYRGYALLTFPASGTHTGEFTDTDIALNDSMLWFTNQCACNTDTSDVRSTTTHELGHALGLHHPSDGTQAMTPSQDWCDDDPDGYENLEQRNIGERDENAYSKIYLDDCSILEYEGRDKPVATSHGARLVEPIVFPNPFNPEVTIAFDLGRVSRVQIEVYDNLGRTVRTLWGGSDRPPGRYQVAWDGTGDDGSPVASGTYYIRRDVDGTVDSRKVTLIR